MEARIQLLQVWRNGGDHQPGGGLGVGQLEPLLIGNHGQNFPRLLHLQCLPDLVTKSLHGLLGGESLEDNHEVSHIVAGGHGAFLVTSNLSYFFNLLKKKQIYNNDWT